MSRTSTNFFKEELKKKTKAINQGLALFALSIGLCLNGIPVIFEKDAQKETLNLYPLGDLLID